MALLAMRTHLDSYKIDSYGAMSPSIPIYRIIDVDSRYLWFMVVYGGDVGNFT